MVEDGFSPIERAIREVCHTRDIPQPDIWERGGVHEATLCETSEFRVEYVKFEDGSRVLETLVLGRWIETLEGKQIRSVQVRIAYVGETPTITADVYPEFPNATLTGRKQQAQMGKFIEAADELVGVYAGRSGKEIDRQLLAELVGDFYDLIEVAQIYFKAIKDWHPPVSDN